MASYTRLGSYLLASDLETDPIGNFHLGLALAGSAFDRHVLVRTFSDEAVAAGLSAGLSEARRLAERIKGCRGLGAGFQIETGRHPFLVCDYQPGRSLAGMLRKTREEQIPLGVDEALSVVQGLAQALVALSDKGLHHGALGPHCLWLSFEGATHVLDAPISGLLEGLLPRAPRLGAALAPYRCPGLTGLQQDLYALGAILFELLTLEPPPRREAIPEALDRATLAAAQEEGPIPAELKALLRRLLVEGQGFADLEAFSRDLERVLFDGEFSPTTFSMAFFLHTLFRDELEQDAQAMKSDQGADFTPFLPSEAGPRTLLPGIDNSNRNRYFAYAGGTILVLFALMGHRLYVSGKRTEELQTQLAGLQREKADNDNRILDITKQEASQQLLQDQLQRESTEARTAEERTKASKDLEEARLKSAELARQKTEALKKNQELAAASTSIAQSASKPAAPAPVPVPAPVPAPAPVPVATAPPAANPAPPRHEPAPAAAPAPAEAVETPVAITSRVAPIAPRVANKAFLPADLRNQDIKVSLRVFVDAQGRPLKVVIVKGVDGPFGFNGAAQKAAQDSTYAPATRNGKPVTGWVAVEYNFGRVK